MQVTGCFAATTGNSKSNVDDDVAGFVCLSKNPVFLTNLFVNRLLDFLFVVVAFLVHQTAPNTVNLHALCICGPRTVDSSKVLVIAFLG
jgi:hypothetical protein